METMTNLIMDDFDFRSLNLSNHPLGNYSLESKNQQLSWQNGKSEGTLNIIINGQTQYEIGVASPSAPTPLLGTDVKVFLNANESVDLSNIKLYDGEYYDSNTQLAHKRTRTFVLTGDETLDVYEYNGLRGIQIVDNLPESLYRYHGICSHTNKVGRFKDSDGNYLWIGYNNRSTYWIGILDALGFQDITLFRLWLISQKENGTPVIFQYQTEEYTETLPYQSANQQDGNNVLSNEHNELGWKKIQAIYQGQPEIIQEKLQNQILWEKTIISDSTFSSASKTFEGNRIRPLKEVKVKGEETEQTLYEGYNLFDPNAVKDVNVYINKANGREVVPSSGQWRSSDYIPVKQYYDYVIVEKVIASASSAGLAYYNSNKTFVKGYSSTDLQKKGGRMEAPKDSAYIRFSWNVSGNENWRNGDIWFYDPAAHGTITDYEPYVGGMLAPNPLYPQIIRGNQDEISLNDTTIQISNYNLQKLGELQDEADIQSGEVIRRVGAINLEDLDYTVIGKNCFRSVQRINNFNPVLDYDPIIVAKCDCFRIVNANSTPSQDMSVNFTPYKEYLQIKCSLAATAEELKSLVHGFKFYYELIYPVKETKIPMPLSQIKGVNTINHIGNLNNEIAFKYFTHI